MRRATSFLMACSSPLALFVAAPVSAQSGAPATGAPAQVQEAAAGASATGQLDEIVVTAEKRPSTEQRTPIALTVATGAQLAANGVTDINGLTNVAPTVQIAQNNANTLITIRGVSSRDYSESGDPAVAVSIDNFYLQRAFALNAALFDVNRIEVLRGPQGTLYGRNATAGAVNIATNRPSTKGWSLDAAADIGNYGLLNTEAAVNVPVSDTLAVRFAGTRKTHKGYRDNSPLRRGDDDDTTGARASVLWQPTSRLTATVIGEYTHIGGVGAVIDGVPYDRVRPNGTLDIGNTRRFALNNQGYTRITTKAVRGSLSYDLGFATLSYFGGFQRSVLHRDNDQDGSLLANFGFQQNEDVRDQNHELRLVSNGTSRFTWQGGLYYFHETDKLLTFFQIHQPPAAPIDFYTFSYRVTSQSKAAFAQVGYQLTDTLKAEAGIRYTDDKKTQIGYNILAGAFSALDNHYTGDKITWHGGLNWQVTPRNLLYAKVDRGYKAGGYTSTTSFGPEVITAYEVGSKNRFFDNRLQINLTGFYYDYKDLQVQQNDPVTALNNVLNAGKARIYGGEFEGVWSLTRDDRVDLNLAYLHSRYTKFCTVTTDPCPAANSLAGNELSQAPKWALGGGVEHVFHIGDATLTARAQSRYQTRTYFTILNRPSEQQKAYSKTDLLLTYAPERGPWSITAYVRNLENSTILNDSEEAAYAGGYLLQFAPPRTYGGRIAVHF